MAREHRLITWCDICLNSGDGEEDPVFTEGTEITLTVAGIAQSKPRVLAMCDPHKKELADPFLDVFERLSIENPDSPRRSVSSAAPKVTKPLNEGPEDPQTCLVCARMGVTKVLKNAQSLAVHGNRAHGLRVKQYRGISEETVSWDVDRDTGLVTFAS